MYFESHPVHVNVLCTCICFVFYTCLFVHCCELDFIYAMAIFNSQKCMYVNGILTQLPDLMRVIGHSCHFINEDLNIDFFLRKVRGRPFDSWGGGLWFFCEKKDCSANF